jgi:glutamate formiminotransferase/formiminotetrahydrofolate cyclodeaminase
VIGVRFPLIAYNINLNTTDLDIARKIARAIRFRDGGYRFTKALGFEIREQNCVQVSINMTNYTGTPLYRVFETVKREAERYGVTIRESEVVGLTPQQALIDAAVWYLQLDTFKNEQVLENRLEASDERRVTSDEPRSTLAGLAEFVEDVAAPTATPGGGSVSAYSGALGVSLLTMVVGLTIGKKGYEAVQNEMAHAKSILEPLRGKFIGLVKEDSEAFERVMAAFKLPKATDEDKARRSAAIQEATKGACEVPLRVMALAVEGLKHGVLVAQQGNRNSITDCGVGGACLRTAIEGAALNVQINLPSLKDAVYVERTRAETGRLASEGAVLAQTIMEEVEAKVKVKS